MFNVNSKKLKVGITIIVDFMIRFVHCDGKTESQVSANAKNANFKYRRFHKFLAHVFLIYNISSSSGAFLS